MLTVVNFNKMKIHIKDHKLQCLLLSQFFEEASLVLHHHFVPSLLLSSNHNVTKFKLKLTQNQQLKHTDLVHRLTHTFIDRKITNQRRVDQLCETGVGYGKGSARLKPSDHL